MNGKTRQQEPDQRKDGERPPERTLPPSKKEQGNGQTKSAQNARRSSA